MKIINFIKKKQNYYQTTKLYENGKMNCICKEKFEDKYITDKKQCKVRDHCHDTGK